MIMPIHAIRLSKIKRRKKLPPEMLKNSNSSPLAAGSNGGDERARTADLLVANQALSRLSYIPILNPLQGPARDDEPARLRSTVHPRHRSPAFHVMRLVPIHSDMVGLPGFEPGTSRLSGARSDQLSYRPATLPARTASHLPRRDSPRHSAEIQIFGIQDNPHTRCGVIRKNRIWTARDGPSTLKRRFVLQSSCRAREAHGGVARSSGKKAARSHRTAKTPSLPSRAF